MCTRARCFFARFNRLKLSAPLVEASPGHPELLGQLIDAHTGPHALYGHALELPGISLSSLHSCFLSRRVCPSRVCQFKGSFHFWGEPLRWHSFFGHSFRFRKSVLASPSRRRGLGKGTAFESPSPAVL